MKLPPNIRVRPMDKLAERLREDAERIDATISEELDARISASLQGIRLQHEAGPARTHRPRWFWWASSLSGVAAALAVIAIVNLRAPEPVPAIADVSAKPLVLPAIRWRAETAVLTSPLEQEIEDLQADLKKAEEAVKEDIDRLF
jgi:hypothetical protein